MRAYAALAAQSVESRFEALRTATTPLIGRDEEVDVLLRRWDQAKAGDGCAVLISGEPGIGKSRITRDDRGTAQRGTAYALRFFCSPYHQDSALYPAIAQLERAAGFRREDTAEQRLDKLEAVLAQATNDISEAVPLLADLLSIPTGTATRHSISPRRNERRRRSRRRSLSRGVAARQPVLCVRGCPLE